MMMYLLNISSLGDQCGARTFNHNTEIRRPSVPAHLAAAKRHMADLAFGFGEVMLQMAVEKWMKKKMAKEPPIAGYRGIRESGRRAGVECG